MEKQLKEIEIWKTLRGSLNNNYELSEQWQEAIRLFDRRITMK